MTQQFLAKPSPTSTWVALAIGNSRLHWGVFVGDRLQQTQNTPHLESILSNWQSLLPVFEKFSWQDQPPELWLASVVPAQTEIWQTYPNLHYIQLADIPLQNIYPTFGLDRAITLWGAGHTYGWPTLVIDGGTALTLTGADAHASLVGGAILPGLRLQMRSLHEGTARLPLVELPATLPQRWATDTSTAMQSGILYTAIAGLSATITQWSETYPHSQIVLTGGDAQVIANYLRKWESQPPIPWLNHLTVDPTLIFKGIAVLRAKTFTTMS
jgi:type III pantothenate kinase